MIHAQFMQLAHHLSKSKNMNIRYDILDKMRTKKIKGIILTNQGTKKNGSTVQNEIF